MRQSKAAAEKLVPVVILFASLSVWVFLAASLNIWIDEFCTLTTIGRPVGDVFDFALHWELQPPAYFLLVRLLLTSAPSLFAVRLFSAACAFATVICIYNFLKPRGTVLDRILFLSILVTAPKMIWMATEGRSYALQLLCFAVMCIQSLKLVTDGVNRPRLLWWGLAFLLGFYCHYYTAFLAAILAISMILFLDSSRARAHVALTMIGLAALCLPVLLWLPEQISASHALGLQTEGLFRCVLIAGGSLMNFVIPIRDVGPLPRALGCLFFLGGAVGFIRQGRRDRTGRFLILLATFCALVAVLLAAVLKIEFASGRHLLFAFIPFMLSAFFFVSRIENRFLRNALFACMLIANIGADGLQFGVLAKNGDWKNIASFVQTHEKRVEPIFVFPAEDHLLRYHYTGLNAIYPMPIAAPHAEYNLTPAIVSSPAQVDDALRVAGEAEHLWMIIREDEKNFGVNRNQALLESSLQNRYFVIGEEDFFCARVLYLSKNKGDQAPFHPTARIGPHNSLCQTLH